MLSLHMQQLSQLVHSQHGQCFCTSAISAAGGQRTLAVRHGQPDTVLSLSLAVASPPAHPVSMAPRGSSAKAVAARQAAAQGGAGQSSSQAPTGAHAAASASATLRLPQTAAPPSPAGGLSQAVPPPPPPAGPQRLPSASSASATGTVDNQEDHISGSVVVSAECWYECGTATGLYNVGNDRCVKMCCGLCNSSRRALETQAKTSKALKAYLDDLKKNKQGQYKRQVRAGRIIPGSRDHPQDYKFQI